MSGGLLDRVRGTSGFVRLKEADAELPARAWLRFRSAVHYLRRGGPARRRIVARYLDGTAEPRLHVGAGGERLPGWLNSDLVAGDVYLDLTRPLPLPDSSFAYAFGEHVIEHISERQGERLLRELHRVLRPGGVLRITTPDLRKIIAIYEDRNPVIGLPEYAEFLDGIAAGEHRRGAQVLNTFMRAWGHRYVYDEEDLRVKLEAAGFAAVRRLEPGESEHDALRGVERHGPPWENDAEAMCLEASVPA